MIQKAEESPKAILNRLIVSCGAMTALLISKEGHSMAEAGDVSYLNTKAMAALVAGMFSATREVARMVGEQQFSILLQQGEKRHIHISLITDSCMMIVIFEDYQKVGLIRHAARKSGKTLQEYLNQQEEKQSRRSLETSESEISVPTFKEYALNLIDRIFEGDD